MAKKNMVTRGLKKADMPKTNNGPGGFQDREEPDHRRGAQAQ